MGTGDPLTLTDYQGGLDVQCAQCGSIFKQHGVMFRSPLCPACLITVMNETLGLNDSTNFDSLKDKQK